MAIEQYAQSINELRKSGAWHLVEELVPDGFSYHAYRRTVVPPVELVVGSSLTSQWQAPQTMATARTHLPHQGRPERNSGAAD
jgi:uncharacterized protein (DUF697 family)